MRDATCARPEETKKENQQRKKPYTAANWIFAHTIHVDGSKLVVLGGSYKFQHQSAVLAPSRYCSPSHHMPIMSSSPLVGMLADNTTGKVQKR